MAKVIRFNIPKVLDVELGTVTFKADYTGHGDEKFYKGQTVKIGRALMSPVGGEYYKVFETKVWVTAKEVTDINVKMEQKRVYRSVL